MDKIVGVCQSNRTQHARLGCDEREGEDIFQYQGGVRFFSHTPSVLHSHIRIGSPRAFRQVEESKRQRRAEKHGHITASRQTPSDHGMALEMDAIMTCQAWEFLISAC